MATEYMLMCRDRAGDPCKLSMRQSMYDIVKKYKEYSSLGGYEDVEFWVETRTISEWQRDDSILGIGNPCAEIKSSDDAAFVSLDDTAPKYCGHQWGYYCDENRTGHKCCDYSGDSHGTEIHECLCGEELPLDNVVRVHV